MNLAAPMGWAGNYASALLRAIPFLWHSAPKETAFIVAATLLQGIVPAISIWINKEVVDNVAEALAQSRAFNLLIVATLAGAWILALLLDSLLQPWSVAAQGNLNDKLTARINLMLMQKADTFADLSRFEDPQFYDELQMLREQVHYQPLNLLANLAEGGRALITLLAAIALLLPLGFWIPLLIAIAAIPQVVISFQYEMKIWLSLFEKSPEARRMQYCTSIMLTDTYAKEARLFQLGNFFISRYLQAFNSLHGTMKHLRLKQALWSASLAILSTLGNGFAFFWVVRQAFLGLISPGNVLLFVQSLAYLQQNLEGFIKIATILYETLLYMEQFFNFMETEPVLIVPQPGEPVPNPLKQGIAFNNVSFSYPDNRLALSNISFVLHPGEKVALVGENGAGKTTIVKLLARFYDPTEGSIDIDGIDLKIINLTAWRDRIAAAFQDFGRYALTLAENVALGNLTAINDADKIRLALQKAGIDELVSRLPEAEQTPLGKQFGGTELSGGEWQKLALARAFARDDAQLLILDEPTAALDPRSEYEIYRRFVELTAGKTALLITHRLASVLMADRILVLKSGRLIESGTHAELLQQGGEYATLWEMQVKQYGL